MKVLRCASLAVALATGLGSRAGFAADGPAETSVSATPVAQAPASQTPAAEAPVAAAPAEPRSRGGPTEATQHDPSHRSRTLRTLGWVGIALGAEAAVVASVTSFMLLHEKAVRDDECNAQKLCSPRGLDANGSIATLVSWNTASWIVMGAALGAGAYLLITNRPDTKVSATVAVAPNPGGVGIGLHGAF